MMDVESTSTCVQLQARFGKVVSAGSIGNCRVRGIAGQ